MITELGNRVEEGLVDPVIAIVVRQIDFVKVATSGGRVEPALFDVQVAELERDAIESEAREALRDQPEHRLGKPPPVSKER